jgi:acetylglutamate kinase
VPELSVSEAHRMIADGTISGGMIPKVETCLAAVAGGVEAAVIMDGRVDHALLLEIFTSNGAGTLVRAN